VSVPVRRHRLPCRVPSTVSVQETIWNKVALLMLSPKASLRTFRTQEYLVGSRAAHGACVPAPVPTRDRTCRGAARPKVALGRQSRVGGVAAVPVAWRPPTCPSPTSAFLPTARAYQGCPHSPLPSSSPSPCRLRHSLPTPSHPTPPHPTPPHPHPMPPPCVCLSFCGDTPALQRLFDSKRRGLTQAFHAVALTCEQAVAQASAKGRGSAPSAPTDPTARRVGVGRRGALQLNVPSNGGGGGGGAGVAANGGSAGGAGSGAAQRLSDTRVSIGSVVAPGAVAGV
jgi:hypothetical protein